MLHELYINKNVIKVSCSNLTSLNIKNDIHSLCHLGHSPSVSQVCIEMEVGLEGH